jgi:hypothetical protein
MSVSQFKSFERCQHAALAEIRGKYKREKSTALIVGGYVDAHFDGTMAKFMCENPEIFKKDGTLKADYISANAIIARMQRDRALMRYMNGEKQVIMTGQIKGVQVKIMIDSFLPGKAIVDRKIMANFAPVYTSDYGYQAWYQAWGYDLQGAVYQEIVRQNTGLKLPFILAGATKEKTPDIDLLQIDQGELDFCLERFADKVELYDAIKKRIIKPERCEKCDYCKDTKRLTAPRSSIEIAF